MLTPEANRRLERLDTIGICWEAVTGLMIPGRDLHCVDRDKLATLFTFIADEYNRARQDFTEAMKTR
ncbi:hypothetical protein [Pseudomonas jilinensis]|uniref:Uncharacterized protein n=1 Tax=Pseudomonas jilinensis TaxID=2078689 RepID=A0A396S6Y7_9PSED|nr:hypothetical protein [Pseudomonas jilinensis]RHW21901.1 hypothetical protein C2846_05410 [Pseudomonas jilinensis]